MTTVFITGASAGFGSAIDRRFASDGCRTILAGRRRERLTQLADELGRSKSLALSLDVRDREAVAAAIAELPTDFAEVDLLVNNAGLAQGLSAAQNANLDDWQTMIDTNITAMVVLTRKLLPQLIARKGAIIAIGSVAGSYLYPGGNVYAGSKAFVNHFTLALRADLHGTGVRVTSIEPGMVETEFTLVRTGSQQASDDLYRGVNPMTGQDIADTILWIATLPPHLNINRLELMPVNQDFAGFRVARDT